MNILTSRKVVVSCTMLASLAGLAGAEPPAILDRVPAGSAIVFVTRDLQASHDRTKTFTKMIESAAPLGEGDENPFEMAEKLLAIPGINKNGSMAMVMAKMSAQDAPEGEEPEMVVLMPVSDFAAAVKHFGGEPGPGVIKIKIEENDTFVRDIGGGFAVISPIEQLVKNFEGKPGNMAAHSAALGASGRRIADKASNLLIADVAAMRPSLEQAAKDMDAQGQMMADLAGPDGGEQAGQAVDFVQGAIESIAKDGTSVVVGLSADDAGIMMEMASNFREGTESAKRFQKGGNSGALLARLPNKPFYLAFAMDMTSPAVKSWAAGRRAAAGDKADAPDFMRAMNLFGEKTRGSAVIIGANPAALMGGGVFVNTTAFISSEDPKGMLESVREAQGKLSGAELGGMKMKVDFRKEAAEIGGVKVDVSTTTMEVNPNEEAGFQAQMVMGMLFGQGGAIGQMIAPVENGLVMTMSQNTPLMADAIDAAKSGNGIGGDAQIKATQARLPADRMFEVYLGSRSIMEAVSGFITMMTGENLPLPAEISPVALAGASDAGSMSLHLYIPNDVISASLQIAQAMEAAEGGDEEEPMDGGDTKPQF